MSGSADRQPACGFCDGTGLWIDPDAGPGGTDPCPLCEGSGATPGVTTAEANPAPDINALGRVVALLQGLTQAARQQLYELLHARYDCRIYR